MREYVLIRYNLTTESDVKALVIPRPFWGELMGSFLRIGTVLDRNESMFRQDGWYSINAINLALKNGTLVYLFSYRNNWDQIIRVSIRFLKKGK